MFIVHITFAIKHDRLDSFGKVARDCTDIALTHQGCETYEFHHVLQKENVFILYEEWQTQEDFKRYKLSQDFKRIGDILTPALASVPTTRYWAAEAADYEAFNRSVTQD